ncbi:DUF1007 family protein [Roseovarius sp. 2305UL8-3]|uniref:DUF1007 family protein n=1 Tax=Roseovarius conchicola TaxID=3121636 RepID=UPI0035299B4D
MRYRFALLMMLALAYGPASAHPHIFVDTKTGFHVNEDGLLTGLEISWTYDPFTTLFLFDVLDLDRDGDGELNDEDYAAILRGETEWADDYVGDIYLEVNKKVHPHLKPVDAEAVYRDDQITVRFDLPLAEPVQVPGQEVVLRVYDPNYYYAYSVVETTGQQSLPAPCETSLHAFEPDAVTSDLLITLGTLSREETPEQANVGRLFSDEVVLSCD